MPFIPRPWGRLHYLDEGHGPVLLLLHAFPLSAEIFRPQVEALASRFRFLLPDHRGFGLSDTGAEPARMTALAEDALAVLDDAGVSAAVVGGVSMGGYATMSLVRQAPKRVRAIVLADTQASADDEAGKLRREETAKAVIETGSEFLVDAMLPKLLSPHAPAELKIRVAALIRKTAPEGAAAALRGMALRSDSKDVLKACTVPSLVVVGEEDALTPPVKAEEMAALLPHSKLVKIAQSGHLSNLERPDEFNRALTEFLESLPATA